MFSAIPLVGQSRSRLVRALLGDIPILVEMIHPLFKSSITSFNLLLEPQDLAIGRHVSGNRDIGRFW